MSRVTAHMDNNNPTDPNNPQAGGLPAPPNPWAAPDPSAPSLSMGQPTSIEALPGNGAVSTEGQITDTASPVVASSVVPQANMPINMSSEPSGGQSPWGAAIATTPTQPADAGVIPQTTFDQPQPFPPPATESSAPAGSPPSNNPFLQPNNGASFSIPSSSDTSLAGAPLPDANAVAAMPPAEAGSGTEGTSPWGAPAVPTAPSSPTPEVPNPMASSTPDPLNTAFSPTGSSTPNPFAPQNGAPLPDANAVAAMPPAEAAGAGGPTNPSAQNATNPWDLPAVPAGAQPADAINPVTVPPSPMTPASEQPGDLASNPQIPDVGQPGSMPAPGGTQPGQIPDGSQSGPLDLSSLTSTPVPINDQAIPATPPTSTVTPANSTQPGNPLPQVPTENAPTDLSHLIGGEEQASANGVYTPPIAKDQNPAVTPVQTPTPAEGAAGEHPAEKHLNLTKVLLVAGIPIILIVAALSAYLILGVGQQATPQETSLPVEQTQAPLTNPPQQIVAPSPSIAPATIPDPSLSGALPAASTLPSPSPAGSLSPAMQAAQRQAASPSPLGTSASPSPASSASTSLPVN